MKNSFTTLLFMVAFAFSSTALSVWHYQGFEGSLNKIEVTGDVTLIQSPYPNDWSGFGKNIFDKCLCKSEDVAKLKKFKETYLKKSLENSLTQKVTSGTYLKVMKNNSLQVEVVGFQFPSSYDSKKAYKKLSKKKDLNFALMRADKFIYVAKKSPSVPDRAFIHFVRGYDFEVNKSHR